MDNDSWNKLVGQLYGYGDRQYWLIQPGHDEAYKLLYMIKTLVAAERIYAFDEYMTRAEWIKPGDLVCFELPGKGIAAHAEVESGPVYRLHYKVEDPVSCPWVITLKDVHIYLDDPVRMSLDLSNQLDLRPNPRQCCFTYGLPRVDNLTEHDFRLLTKNTK